MSGEDRQKAFKQFQQAWCFKKEISGEAVFF
jgi:hypothetical protein